MEALLGSILQKYLGQVAQRAATHARFHCRPCTQICVTNFSKIFFTLDGKRRPRAVRYILRNHYSAHP
jgi:hypothetical protein